MRTTCKKKYAWWQTAEILVIRDASESSEHLFPFKLQDRTAAQSENVFIPSGLRVKRITGGLAVGLTPQFTANLVFNHLETNRN